MPDGSPSVEEASQGSGKSVLTVKPGGFASPVRLATAKHNETQHVGDNENCSTSLRSPAADISIVPRGTSGRRSSSGQ
jgi:hypothetical protein